MSDVEKGGAEETERSPFTEHLEELRTRVIKCFIALLAGFGVCYGFSDVLLELVARPLSGAMPEGSSLTMIRVTEGFLTHLKLSLLGGLFLSCPIWFFQIWKFVAPGLYTQERKYVWPFVFAATLFFLTGASFAYFVVMPWGLEFLLGYAIPTEGAAVQMDASLSIGDYLSFFTKISVAFGLVFELPVVVFFLAKMGLITHKTLSRGRGVAVVVIFIVAAFLTPPDVFTQLMMAVPLLILYEISIVVARVFGAKVEEDEEEASA